MPTLQISINQNTERVELIHDIGSQLMKLRQVSVEWGLPLDGSNNPIVPTGTDIGKPGCLLDLTDMGASTSEIVGYSPNVGSTPFLYLPRPNPTVFDATTKNMNPTTTFYNMFPDLTFHTGDVFRGFFIRTFQDSNPISLATFGANELRSITLYFEYQTNDINR